MTPSTTNIPYGFCHCGCGQETLRATKTTSNGPVENKTRYKKGEPYKYCRGHANRITLPIEEAAPFKIEGVYCRLLPLTMGLYAIIDASDYLWLMQWKWQARWAKSSNSFYAGRTENGKVIFLHVALAGKDHINRLPLDCRRDNLRAATHRQNSYNRGPAAHNKSGFKGVHKDRRCAVWIAYIEHSCVGRFTSPEDAARAYDREAVRRFGEFAWLNFPEERSIHERALLESNRGA